jgi:transketolase
MALVLARYEHPAYIRYPRADVPVVFDESYKFSVGKAVEVRSGSDVVIFTTGTMLAAALGAAELLAAAGIDAAVVHFPTIKPLDEKAIVKYAKKIGRVVTVEEHQIAGGFGSAIAETLTSPNIRSDLISVLRIGIDDQYGQSASPDELLEFYGLTPDGIARQVRKFVK